MPISASERSLAGKAAVHHRWARTASTAERSAATAPARSAFDERFVVQVDPDGALSPDELARAVENARSAYFSDLRRRGIAKRRREAAAAAERAVADDADRDAGIQDGAA